jgi:hypothetical protein
MAEQDWVISKRQLGILLIVGGVLGGIAIFGLDVLRGKAGDFGPSQALVLACSFWDSACCR